MLRNLSAFGALPRDEPLGRIFVIWLELALDGPLDDGLCDGG